MNRENASLYFLDTNICSYIINGRNEHKLLREKILACNYNVIKIPSIVVAELYYGIDKGFIKGFYSKDIFEKKKILISEFLAQFQIINFDYKSARIYAKIKNGLEKKGKLIEDNDIIIAATVFSKGGILITNDKHFERIEKLKIDNWLK